jgi:ATP-binding cassette subfamily C (CFTR/MRP) protein 1
MITFIAFAIQAKVSGSEPLTAVKALTSLAIIRLVAEPAALLISTIAQVPNAMACFERIQSYLVSAERQEQRLEPVDSRPVFSTRGGALADGSVEMVRVRSNGSPSVDGAAIVVKNATICPADNVAPALQNISFTIKQSSLTILFGPVGCGKSTLIKAIMGELICESGSIEVSSLNMAYCRQTTWLPNTSIQRNICGLSRGIAIDEVWYQSVMKACALDIDVGMLPDGDRTVIGSKGVTLSGGQKQRLVRRTNIAK